MKFMCILLIVSGSALAYTSSPAGNNKVKDPSWHSEEKRDPASTQMKGNKPEKKSHKKSEEMKQ